MPEQDQNEKYSFEVGEYGEGDYKGFKFTYPSFNSLDAATELYGSGAVLALFNTIIANRIRMKVKNDLPRKLSAEELKDKHQKLLLTHPDGILNTQDEALSWRPSRDDIESPDKLFKASKKAFAEGNFKLGMELMAKSQQAAMAKYGIEAETADA